MRNAKFFLMIAFAATAFSQGTTAPMDGSVMDTQGALIVAAEVVVVNVQTGQTFRTKVDERGHWVVPSLETGVYRVTVSAPGFKKTFADSVKMDTGVPATVNLTLEIGAVTETVEVTGGAEILQTASATVSQNLTGQQIRDLPIASRNATDLIVVQTGTQTPAGPRNSTFNGLPQSTVNMTYDGVNIQDNLLKNGSGGAFYPVVYPRLDAIEEVSVTTAAAGADGLAEGAVQVKFVTRAGTNQWHGGGFIQERNTFFNANNYFNNQNGLPRDRINLHQLGVNVGGPIRKDRIFFFANYEVFRFPQTWSRAPVVLTDAARSGIFTYKGGTGAIQQVNLYQLAASHGFPGTPDPIIANTLSQIAGLANAKTGVLRDRIAAGDYNANTFNFQAPGSHKIDFPTIRLDAQLTQKHHLETVYNINPYRLFPDGINGVLPFLPGSGTVLGSAANAGQREGFFTAVAAVRSAWTSRLTSEIRFGIGGGNVLFFDAITPALFSQWRGYAPIFNSSSNPFTASNQSRRNDPVQQLHANASWTRSGHLLNFGGSFSRINEWISSQNTQVIPQVNFGVTGTDPIGSGTTNIFDTKNFPNSSPTDLANAAALYAQLTGRVSSLVRSVALDENTKTYGASPTVDRLRQTEFGLFIQDSWHIHPKLTLNYGVRFEDQNPFQSLNGVYTRPGFAGLYGVSGVGNLFKPGTLTGAAPLLTPVGTGGVQGYPPTRFWSPTLGLAWVLPHANGPLGWLAGKAGQSVLRVGFAMTSTRGDFTGITNTWGANQGRTINTTVDPNNNAPDVFGPAGSVLFRDANLPARTVAATPSYPIAVAAGTSIREFDPNLKSRYVQSWNIGYQRSLAKDTVLEVRYVGNRSERLWTTLNLNEVNIFENGFLEEFKIAQANLALARQTNPNSTQFAGLPGQSPLPIIATAIGNSDLTTATRVAQGQAGSVASSISGTASRMAKLIAAGRPVNFFIVNPATGGSAVNLTTNLGGTTYNAMQLEVRRRMSAGLLFQGSYVWSHSLSTGNIATLRDLDGYTTPSGFDTRHAVKLNWIYELPFGPGRHFLGGLQNPMLRRAAEGWQFAGVSRVQSGTPNLLTGGRATYNAGESGVVLHNITESQLQGMIQIRKTTDAAGNGQVYWLPQSIIDNTNAAFEVNGKTLKNLDPTQPYIGPPTTAGQLGYHLYVNDPWLSRFDLSLVKHTRIREKQDVEFRVQALNAFNTVNFFLGSAAANGAGFGRTTNSYRDINSTNDPGSRIIEFVLRYKF